MKQINSDMLMRAMEGIGEDLLERSEAAGALPAAGQEEVMPAQEEAPRRKEPADRPDRLQAQKEALLMRRSTGRGRRRALISTVLALAAVLLFALAARGILRTSTGGVQQASSVGTRQESEAASVTGDVPQERKAAKSGKADLAENAVQEALPAAGAAPLAEESAAEALNEEAGASYSAAAAAEAMDAESDAVREASPNPQLFFLYGGRRYCEAGYADARDVAIGAYVTSVRIPADEQKKDSLEYAEGEGSVAGDVYAVQGTDEEEMLCIPLEDGRVRMFVAVP